MDYSYKMKNGEILKVFFNNLVSDMDTKNGIYGTISFWKNNNKKYKEYIRSVRKDENGKRFFTWDKEKIYLDDFIAYSPKELVKRFYDKDNTLYGGDICRTLQKYGMDSLRLYINVKPLEIIDFPGIGRFTFEVTSSFENKDKYVWIEYRFFPEYLRMPEDNYMLKLIPAKDKDLSIYPKKDYYVDDLAGLIFSCTDTFKLVENLRKDEKSE